MTKSEKSAIIGMWRMGAEVADICDMLELSYNEIKNWINDYKNKINERRELDTLENPD